jgi:hypothetical protein
VSSRDSWSILPYCLESKFEPRLPRERGE